MTRAEREFLKRFGPDNTIPPLEREAWLDGFKRRGELDVESLRSRIDSHTSRAQMESLIEAILNLDRE